MWVNYPGSGVPSAGDELSQLPAVHPDRGVGGLYSLLFVTSGALHPILLGSDEHQWNAQDFDIPSCFTSQEANLA